MLLGISSLNCTHPLKTSRVNILRNMTLTVKECFTLALYSGVHLGVSNMLASVKFMTIVSWSRILKLLSLCTPSTVYILYPGFKLLKVVTLGPK